ncbi:hypothetical protein K2173_009995 [Erythroxylum novogranatense]|uniref:Myb/SANT-like domain-containing protein n=1 Tax=Erythroxylum novogranatense TaxID=1862640 RepID=A0AAV8T0U8_9ROSI|nr:hypothetical protein K2173_009995 [Erythroxylum novogranatense]
MGGKGIEVDDAKDWPEKNEYAFLLILYERVKNDPKHAPSFKPSDWEAMDKELTKVIMESYGIEKLKGKYNRLRTKHRQFSELLNHTGVTYESESNTVHAPEEVWQMFFQKNRVFKTFRRKGCSHYELLGQIFNNSTATGHLHHASTQLPPTSDEEREVETEFLNKGVHVNESEKSSADSKKRVIDYPGERRAKKEAKMEMLNGCLEMWASSLTARSNISKLKLKTTIKQIFMKMSTNRKMEWLLSLELNRI